MWKLSDSASRAALEREDPLLEIAIIKLANYSIEAERKESSITLLHYCRKMRYLTNYIR